MNIRTITIGVPLEAHRTLDELEPRLQAFLDAMRSELAGREIAIRTARLTTSPVRDGEGQRLNPAQTIGVIRSLAQSAERLNLRWFNVPFDLTRPVHNGAIEAQCELALEVIRRFPRSFINLIAASEGRVSQEAAARAARFIKSVASLDASGYVNFRVGVACNIAANTPFFPFSFSSDEVGFSIGLEMARELTTIVNGMLGAPLADVRDAILGAVVPQIREIHDVAARSAAEHAVAFHGIDVSIAPYPEEGSSVAQLMELLGLDQFGGHGTLLVTAFLTDVLREIIRRGELRAVGFNGVMLSLLEDEYMGKRNNLNTYSIDSLILYSTVCGCGIDMVPLPGDTFEEEIAAMILDVAAASTALRKPLGVRVLPIPARQEHELTAFNMDFLFNTRIKKVRNLGFAARRLGAGFGFLGAR